MSDALAQLLDLLYNSLNRVEEVNGHKAHPRVSVDGLDWAPGGDDDLGPEVGVSS